MFVSASKILVLFTFLFLIPSCQSDTTIIETEEGVEEISTDEFLQILGQAYTYGYPMVMMDLTKRVTTNIEKPHESRPLAPINQLGHFRSFPDHSLTAVVKPNVDTYYSIAWLDLTEGPQALFVPATDRYYLLPFYDAYTNVFATPGTRTTGTAAQQFVITGPNWNGEIPEGIQHIAAPTNMVWLLGRIQTNSDEDGATLVKDFQDGMRLTPLAAIGDDTYEAPLGKVNEEHASIIPSKTIQDLDINSFFNRMTDLMVDNPPPAKDSLILEQMRRIGIVPGKSFDFSSDNFILKTKLKALPNFIHNKFDERKSNPDQNLLENGWMLVKEGIGSYEKDYIRRAYISYIALGANLPEDAVYPNSIHDINGGPLDSEKKYQVHFAADGLPPVKAFWSLTAYNEDEFLIENEINRYALGDRDDLTFNEDGSLDIYIQRQAPAADKHSNWLPIPQEGPFALTMRLYWPEEEVLDGKWKVPGIIPVEE